MASPIPAWTQEASLESRIDATASILQQLDNRAQACIEFLDTPGADQDHLPCNDFLGDIDGDAVASYLDHCAVLREWREQYVSAAISDSSDDRVNLERLTGIERNCGEDALARRTLYVVPAFNRLLAHDPAVNQLRRDLDQRYRELQFSATDQQLRNELQNAVRTQQENRDAAIQRQWNEIELELIRQQQQRNQ